MRLGVVDVDTVAVMAVPAAAAAAVSVVASRSTDSPVVAAAMEAAAVTIVVVLSFCSRGNKTVATIMTPHIGVRQMK